MRILVNQSVHSVFRKICSSWIKRFVYQLHWSSIFVWSLDLCASWTHVWSNLTLDIIRLYLDDGRFRCGWPFLILIWPCWLEHICVTCPSICPLKLKLKDFTGIQRVAISLQPLFPDMGHDKQHPTQQGPLDAVLNCLLHDPEYLSPQGMIQKSDCTPQEKNRVGIGVLKVLFGSSVAQLFVYCVSVILKQNIYIYIVRRFLWGGSRFR